MQNDQGSKRARLAPQGLEVGKAPEYFLLGDGVARQNFELAKKESINRTVSRVKDSGGLLEFASGLKNSSPILVTGSSGYLGAALIRLLRAHQIPCIGMDLVRASTTDHLGCVSDAAALKEAATGCHAAIHCAALHAPNLDFYTSDDFRRVNVDGTLNILRLASEMKFKGVVFSSTTSLMNTAEVKLRSKAETLVQVASTDYGTPRNIYGETKKAAESLCLGFDTVNVAILRCSRFFVEDAYDSGAAQADRKIERSNNNVKANELLCGSRASLEDTAMAHLVALVRISASENGRMVLGPLILSSVSPLIDATTREEKLAHARQSDLYVGLGWTVPDHIGRILDSRDAWENLAWSPSWSFDRLLSDYKLGMNLNMIEDGYW